HRLGDAGLLRAIHARAASPLEERDPREAREGRDGFRVLEALGLADERDRVALRAAAEAVVEALLPVDVAGPRLLRVERAEPFPGAPRLLQRRCRADERDEVGRREDVALDVVGDVVRRHVSRLAIVTAFPPSRASPGRCETTPGCSERNSLTAAASRPVPCPWTIRSAPFPARSASLIALSTSGSAASTRSPTMTSSAVATGPSLPRGGAAGFGAGAARRGSGGAGADST